MSQSLAKIWTHLVFSTKERYPFLADETVRHDMSYLVLIHQNAIETQSDRSGISTFWHQPRNTVKRPN